MKFLKKLTFLTLGMITAFFLTVNPVSAHSFNVVLIIQKLDITSVQSDQIRKGFMLATTERDSHPDETADGHLGGLDVYVTIIEGTEDVASVSENIIQQNDINIAVIFGEDSTVSKISDLIKGNDVVVIVPGQSPFAQSDLPAVVAFTKSYKQANGVNPTGWSGLGYNAARRIETAVRSLSGVDNVALLQLKFKETSKGFKW